MVSLSMTRSSTVGGVAASYWKSRMKRWPEPGTAAPRVRSARTSTIAVSGGTCPLTAAAATLTVLQPAILLIMLPYLASTGRTPERAPILQASEQCDLPPQDGAFSHARVQPVRDLGHHTVTAVQVRPHGWDDYVLQYGNNQFLAAVLFCPRASRARLKSGHQAKGSAVAPRCLDYEQHSGRLQKV